MATSDYAYNRNSKTRQVQASADFKLEHDKLVITLLEPNDLEGTKQAQKLAITLDADEVIRLMKLLAR